MIIICGGIKGGGGKTTTALNLAIMRGLAGFDVLLIDADSIDNGNASDFSAIRDETLEKKHYTAIKLPLHRNKTTWQSHCQRITHIGTKIQ